MTTATDMSDDARTYYADGFRRTTGGVPCKVFSRRTADGRYIRAKGSPFYDAAFDHPKTGVSRTTVAAPEVVEQIERRETMEAIAAFARATAEPRDNVVHVDFIGAASADDTLAPMPNYEACAAVAAFAMATAALTATPAAETHDEPEATAEPAAPPCAPTASAALLSGVLAVQADMRARLAALEARIAPISSDIEFAPETAENGHSEPNSSEPAASLNSPLPSDPRARAVAKLAAPSTPRRSPARERLLRRYLAMRAERERQRRLLAGVNSLLADANDRVREITAAQEQTWASRERAMEKRRRVVGHIVKLRQRRAFDRMALHAAGESVREAQDEVRRIKVETAAKPVHQNEPAPDLVAQLHREREAAAAQLSTHIERADRIERANAVLIREVQTLSSRAHRAEAALRLREVTALPQFAHVGSPSARVSFQLPVPANGRVQ